MSNRQGNYRDPHSSSSQGGGRKILFIIQKAFLWTVIGVLIGYYAVGAFVSPVQIMDLANLAGLAISKKYVYVFTASIGAAAAVVLGGISGALTFSRFEQREAQLYQTLTSSGGKMSLEPHPEIALALQKFFKDFKTEVPGIIDLSEQGRDIFITNLQLYHRRNDDSDYSNRRGSRSQTVAYFKFDSLKLTGFTLQPNGILLRLIAALAGWKRITDRSYPEFSRKYFLFGENMEQVRELFDGALLEFFSHRQGYHFQGKDQEMVIWKKRKELEGQELDELVNDSKSIFSLIEMSASY